MARGRRWVVENVITVWKGKGRKSYLLLVLARLNFGRKEVGQEWKVCGGGVVEVQYINAKRYFFNTLEGEKTYQSGASRSRASLSWYSEGTEPSKRVGMHVGLLGLENEGW